MSDALSKIPHDVREFFLLTAAEARAKTVPEAARESARHALKRAWQKRDAAEVLSSRGSPAEAMRLAHDAFGLALEGIDRLAAAGAPLSEAARIALEGKAQAEALRVPETDDEVTADDVEQMRVVIELLYAMDAASAAGAAGAADIASMRRRRRGSAIAVAALVVLALVLAVRASRAARVTASGVYGAYPAAQAIDGDPKTEWLMPDHAQSGWIELALGGRRSVRALRILNGHNAPYDDRALHDIAVVCFDGASEVKNARASLELTSNPPWTSVDLGGATCDRVRIEVQSTWREGGALAELDVE